MVEPMLRDKIVIFVLGGPGAGKGTQCNLLAEKHSSPTNRLIHLSAGDLLREERNRPGSEVGELINNCIREGKIVPMHITIGLLRTAMEDSGAQAFLIDGFPRDISQGEEFEKLVCESKAMLFFTCPEETLTQRLLHRGETSQRVDDNSGSIQKRLVTYREQTMPVREWAKAAGKLHEIPAGGSKEEVFNLCSPIIQSLLDNKAHEQSKI